MRGGNEEGADMTRSDSTTLSPGMLSSKLFRERVIRGDVEKAEKLFRERRWTELGEQFDDYGGQKAFIIRPFDPLQLTPFSYDLQIGEEAFSCKDESLSSFPLAKQAEVDGWYWLEPRETVIVRTHEFIALPPCYAATIWPRFNLVREGVFQSMVKIDPTWYGDLGVAITNLSPAKYPIWQLQKFATLIIYELASPTDIELCEPGGALPKPIRMGIPNLGPRESERIREAHANGGFPDECSIEDDQLTIKTALEPEDWAKIRDISLRSEWKNAVNETIMQQVRHKPMGALGLKQLDLILTKRPKGKRLLRSEVEAFEWASAGRSLSDIAVQWGTPFDYVANLSKKLEDGMAPTLRSPCQRTTLPSLGCPHSFGPWDAIAGRRRRRSAR